MRRFDVSRAARRACLTLCGPMMVLGAQVAWAQGLSLDQALAAALAQHPDLRASQMESEAAGAATQQAAAWQNPELATLVEDTRRATRSTTIQLNQPVELGGKREARLGVARAAEGAADVEAAVRRAQVGADLRLAFHAAAVAQERVRLSEELARLATQAREGADRRVQAGKVSPVEALKAQVAEAQALSAVAVAQGEQRATVARLRQAMGEPTELATSTKTLVVEADLARLPSADRWRPLPLQLSASPLVAQAQQEVSRRQALAEVERARRTPDLTVSLGARRDAEAGRNQAILGVSWVLPLFDRNQGAIVEASRREDKARIDSEALRARIGAQAEQALSQLSSALVQAQTLRERVLPAARQAFAASTRGFELGKFGFLDVLDAQRTLFEAETQALSAAAQAFEADAHLHALLGEPTPTKD